MFTSYKFHGGKIILKCLTWKLPVKWIAIYPFFIFVSLANVSPSSPVLTDPSLSLTLPLPSSTDLWKGFCCLLNSAIQLLHNISWMSTWWQKSDRFLDSCLHELPDLSLSPYIFPLLVPCTLLSRGHSLKSAPEPDKWNQFSKNCANHLTEETASLQWLNWRLESHCLGSHPRLLASSVTVGRLVNLPEPFSSFITLDNSSTYLIRLLYG